MVSYFFSAALRGSAAFLEGLSAFCVAVVFLFVASSFAAGSFDPFAALDGRYARTPENLVSFAAFGGVSCSSRFFLSSRGSAARDRLRVEGGILRDRYGGCWQWVVWGRGKDWLERRCVAFEILYLCKDTENLTCGFCLSFLPSEP